MPGTDDRRSELRTPMPVPIWFNILAAADEFVRTQSPAFAELEALNAGPGLEARDDTDLFLLRLDAKLDLVISLLSDNIGRKHYHHKGMVADVSESGVRFFAPMELKEGADLEVGFVIPSRPNRTMDIGARVIWSRPAPTKQGGPPRFLTGVNFTNVLVQDQDDIVHYIFQKQREEIRRSRELE